MPICNDLITGGYIPPKRVEQRKRFIEPNREAVIDYRDCRVDTTDFQGRTVTGSRECGSDRPQIPGSYPRSPDGAISFPLSTLNEVLSPFFGPSRDL
jgi:hypothetical protein